MLIDEGGDDDDDTEDDMEEEEERWWGLWRADEIRKLADWIAIKSGCGEEQPAEDWRRRTLENGGTRSGVQSSHLTPLSDASDTEDEGGEYGRVIPTQNELEALVRSLREYAEVLDWRVWRMEEEHVILDDKENGAAKKSKAVAAQIRPVAPANFYGQ